MKLMIKNIALFVIGFILLGGIDVYAANASISVSSSNVYVGDNVTVTVYINAGSWNVQVSGSGISDSIVGYDMDGNKASSKSYSLNTSNPGTYTVNISGDITDYDTDVNSPVGGSVTVVVNPKKEEPVVVPEQQQEIPSTPTPPTTNNKSNNNTNTNTTNKQTTQETKKEEPVIEEKIEISKFEIIGYELGFDVNKLDYDIDILDGVSDLYIVVEGKELDVIGAGKVSILGKDSIEVTVKHKELEKKYTIKLNKIKNSDIISSSKGSSEVKTKTKNNPIFIVTTVVFFVSTVVLSILYILEKNKHINK